MERTKAVLPEIRVPALILHSLNDRTADAESAIYIREHLGSGKKEIVWLKHSGHLIPVGEEREQVFAAAASFLARLTDSDRPR